MGLHYLDTHIPVVGTWAALLCHNLLPAQKRRQVKIIYNLHILNNIWFDYSHLQNNSCPQCCIEFIPGNNNPELHHEYLLGLYRRPILQGQQAHRRGQLLPLLHRSHQHHRRRHHGQEYCTPAEVYKQKLGVWHYLQVFMAFFIQFE